MKATSCRYFQKMLAEGDWGELSLDSRAAVQVHLAQCERCREVENISGSLSVVTRDLRPKPLSPLMQRRLIQAALDGRMPEAKVVRRLPMRWVLIGAGAAATAAVILTLTLRGTFQGSAESRSETPIAASVVQALPPAGSDRFSSDNFSHPFEADGSLLVLPESTLWGTRETLLSVEEQTPSSARIRLKRGKIVADVDSAKLRGRFVVLTPSARVEVRGTVFSVTVGESGAETVRVVRGTVAVTDFSSGLLHLVTANQQFTVGADTVTFAAEELISNDLQLAGRERALGGEALEGVEIDEVEGPAVALPGASRIPDGVAPSRGGVSGAKQADGEGEEVDSRDLLRMAKELRRDREFKEAKQTYLRLIRRYPSTQTAANAIVALAQMELGAMNDPQSALTHFEEYLKAHPKGLLAEEAWIGRLRALMANNDHGKAVRVSSAYLKAQPDGKMAPEMLRRRGDAHAERGNCKAALKDYRTVIQRWPGSKSFKHAQAGVRACEGDLSE